MNAEKLKKISKRMSYILRHQPDSVGLTLSPGGWVAVEDLLAALKISREQLNEVVVTNDKQRFEYSEDASQIRARQGHSTLVDLQYEAATPPNLLFRGTATRFLHSIFEKGLIKGNRHHVHLSIDRETMIAVGSRHGKPVVLEVNAKQMVNDGSQFYVTGNHVWLTDHVPPQYLREFP
ncbi:RNA 2'-phosphotransferase [Bremerella volcania]|uniref:Probable RNA 2'-phosphotransferase n=1 Tax=Bremerella volcania TaxID=2527984 RepID=A0A518C8V3_9BACT|nr:RNA 2'-phosphotransferase [Bremerella volcania]QDU75653.1 RNA 2'-phosphotransferase [Bremerella volcania]